MLSRKSRFSILHPLLGRRYFCVILRVIDSFLVNPLVDIAQSLFQSLFFTESQTNPNFPLAIDLVSNNNFFRPDWKIVSHEKTEKFAKDLREFRENLTKVLRKFCRNLTRISLESREFRELNKIR